MASPVEDTGARQLRAVTPSDSEDLPMAPCRALWVGTVGDGTVTVIAEDDTTAVELISAGGLLPVRAKRVLSTGTGASNIVAMY
jgi:hypothetical protein